MNRIYTIGIMVLASVLISSCTDELLPERKLLSTRPASMFEEAYPLGNGRIGAMIYGGLDKERIMLNEESLWAGGPVDPYMNPEAYTHLQSVRDALFTEDYPLADKLVKNMQGAYSQSYAPLGDLYIEYIHNDSIQDYSRELDIRHGVSLVTAVRGKTTFTQESFVSYPDQVLAIKLKAKGPAPLSFSLKASSQLPFKVEASGSRFILDGFAPSHAEPNYRGNIPDALKYDTAHCMRFRVIAEVKETDGTISGGDGAIQLSDATEAVILVSIATSFNGYDKDPGLEGIDEKHRCLEILEQASTYDYKALRQRHTDDFSMLFNRLSFTLGAEQGQAVSTRERMKNNMEAASDHDLVALYFQFGRYLLISSSRPGGIPANLQGIWNEHLRPPWSSNYTVNINAEMNYWPAEVCNLSELHGPLLDHIERLSKTGAVTAKTYYDCEGWCCHHNTDIWAMTNPVGDFGRGHPVWANWNMGGTWLATHLWEHFIFTRDTSYLMEFAYPIMKDAATFCLDFLTEAPDGYMVTAPNTSPENMYITDDGYKGCTLYGATSDVAMIMELFSNVIEAANIADDPIIYIELEDMLEKLSPYRIGQKGNLQEWYHDWEDREPTHRHVSHLFGLYPGHSIHPDHTPELADACRRSLELRTNNGTGWSIAWKIALWARLGDGKMALDAINKILTLDENTGDTKYHGGGTYPNLLDAHPPFQIDGNFGATAGIAEMLMQSRLYEISLLPALPESWKEGEIKGLRARGAYTVNISWQGGSLTEAIVRPDYDGPFTVSYKGQKKVIEGVAGRETAISF